MADIKMPESTPCRFEISWQGRCNKPSTNGWCSVHEVLKCQSCGAKATHDCVHTGSLFCGTPLCETCHHSMEGDTHVTEVVFKHQFEQKEREQLALERSRTSPDQRLNVEGNPVNLFELLKKDLKEQGYRLEKVFFLQLEHGLMGFFPAVIDSQKRIIMCLDQGLLVEVWKTLEPRESKMDIQVCYVNESEGIAYADVRNPSEGERSKPEKILTRKEYEEIMAKNHDEIAWAPGLIGGKDIDRADFPRYVDGKVSAHSSV